MDEFQNRILGLTDFRIIPELNILGLSFIGENFQDYA